MVLCASNGKGMMQPEKARRPLNVVGMRAAQAHRDNGLVSAEGRERGLGGRAAGLRGEPRCV